MHFTLKIQCAEYRDCKWNEKVKKQNFHWSDLQTAYTKSNMFNVFEVTAATAILNESVTKIFENP